MDLFVYGTLRSEALMRAVAGPGAFRQASAELPQYEVRPVSDDVVPNIRPSSDHSAHGVVWYDLSDAQIARLDLYEGAFGYPRRMVCVETDTGPIEVQCYLPPVDVKVGDGEWSLDAWERGHLEPGLLAAAELFSMDPLPTPEKLRQMWPMIEARAWSKHRAKAAPATMRTDPTQGAFEIVSTRPPMGSFFRLQSVDVQHQTFSGQRSDKMVRECFFGIDASILLPYDPKRDCVLLVEQARLGPRMRHDPNPWMLEPVAGIIDARETPEQAAIREAKEEAGLGIVALEPAGKFYVSPGATTDYFYTFIGICDIPHNEPFTGGLPEEGEDLRLHPVSFDKALALVDSGEIATGPAQFLIYWLLRHRERLRNAGV